MTEISKRDKKYIIESEEFTCSPKCIGEWIEGAIKYRCKNSKSIDESFATMHKMSGTVIRSSREAVTFSYRSAYEQAFAIYLGCIANYTYGYETFGCNLSVGTYTPDFYLVEAKAFVEIKGIIGIGFRKKLKRFREEYPDVKLLFVPWVLKEGFCKLRIGDSRR